MIRRASGVALLACLFAAPRIGLAQTSATYHLHDEASLIHGATKQLKPADPDTGAVTLQTQNLKNAFGAGDRPIAYFETQSQVPNLAGVIPAESVVTFTIWMKKTAAYGIFYPHAKLFLNNYCCSDTVFVCETNTDPGSSPPPPQLTTTLTKYTLQCTTPNAVTMSTSDRFFLEVDAYMPSNGSPGNHNLYCQLNIEGTLDGNYDSKVVAPLPQPPAISSITPGRAPLNTPVHIVGTNLGSTGTVTFNTTAATTSAWSQTAIDASVPLTASGSELSATVTVTANGATSPGASFTVTPTPSIASLDPPAAAVGQSITIGGSYFLDLQASGSSTVTFNGAPATPTSWSDTSITVPVPTLATSGPVVVTVSGNASAGATFTLVTTGTVAGTITRATGGTALSGATVQAVLTGAIKDSATTAANGTYSISNLDPGTYDVRVAATGFSSEVRSGTSVSANVTTTVNVAMLQPGSISGTVTQAANGTPIVGAAVALYLGPVQKGSVNTDAGGAYAVANLHPGAYTVQAANVGFRTKEQGATISENTNTTSNVSLDAAPAGAVNYVYDELNRLISVIDPSGDAAHYAYDPVGNLLSITRAGANTVSISEFTPNSGPAGTSVTMYGTGFSTTPSSNQVTFGGTPATVTGATANQLAVTAPAGGQIAISAPNGSANTGASVFTLTTAAAGPPTMTGFSPQIWDGSSALTINGTNFDTTPAHDRVNLNVAFASPSTATSSTLSVPVPETATSGRVSVATVAGTATSSNDFYVPPQGYLAANVQSTGRMTVGGNATISLAANKFAMRLFDATPGRRVSVTFSDVTLSNGPAALYDPYGRRVAASSFGGVSAAFLDTVTISSAGTYALLVGSAGSVGNATATLNDIVDYTGTIAPDGSPASVQTGVPGQNGILAFTVPTTRRISLAVGGTGIGGVVSIRDLTGNPLGSVATGILDSLIEPVTVSPGNYRVMADYSGAAVGTLNLNLYTVPDDLTGTITPTANGSSSPLPLNTPGQNALLTLGTPVNSRVGMAVSAGPVGTVTVKNPDNSIAASLNMTAIGQFMEPWPFVAGQTIKVDPSGAGTGTITLTAYDVPADTSGSVTIGGSAVAVPLAVAGQNGTLGFTGAASQQVTVRVTGNTFGLVTVTLLDANGQSLASAQSLSDHFDLSTVTLAGGAYTVKVDPSGTNTGTLNITVCNGACPP